MRIKVDIQTPRDIAQAMKDASMNILPAQEIRLAFVNRNGRSVGEVLLTLDGETDICTATGHFDIPETVDQSAEISLDFPAGTMPKYKHVDLLATRTPAEFYLSGATWTKANAPAVKVRPNSKAASKLAQDASKAMRTWGRKIKGLDLDKVG